MGLVVYNRIAKVENMFKAAEKAYRLLLGGALLAVLVGSSSIAWAASQVPGVTADQILVGNLGPQTGAAAAYDGVRKGILTYFNYVNSQGGVNGRKLKLIAYDDQYQPAKTVQLTRRLVDQDHVFAMLGNIGSPTNAAVEKYIRKKGVPMIMLGSGATRFFQPPLDNYMGAFIASYAFEARVMVHYAIKDLGAKRIAIAYDNDDYGSPINDAATKALKNYPNAKVVARVNFQPTDADLSAQAQKIKQAKPDAILVFATPSPTAHLRKALYNIGATSGIDFLTTQEGGNDHEIFSLTGEKVWDGSYSIAPIPSADTDSKKMKLFVKEFHKAFPDIPPTGQPQLGWAAAQVFVEAVRRTKDLTRENFLKSFYTFNDWKDSLYVGISFNKDNHWGVTSLFINQAKGDQMVPVSGLISIDPKTGKFSETGSVD